MSLLKTFLIGWVFPMVWSSSLEAPRRRPLAGRGDLTETTGDDEQNDSFKNNDDWWKDPFAMFDETEDEYDPESDSSFGSFGLDEDFSESTMEETNENDYPIQNDASNTHTLLNELESEAEPILKAKKEEKKSKIDSTGEVVAQTVNKPEKGDTGTKWSPRDVSNSTTSSIVTVTPQSLALRNPTSPASVVAAPLALLLTAIPKVRVVVTAFPFFKIFCLFGLVRMAQPIFERSTVSRTNRNRDYSSNEDAYHEEEEMGEKSYRSRNPKKWFLRIVHGIGRSSEERLPPARELFNQLEAQAIELSTVKSEKEAMEREYEKTSWALQETQNELTNLQSSSQYLKAQLRDNQEVMEKAIRAERRKAREELARMKEAMLQILQRERKELRQKLTKQKQDSQSSRQKQTGGEGL